jgi:zinc/manganese transport system substrate-binding protein
MILIIALFMVTGAAVVACGDGDGDGGPKVVATNGILQSVAQRVAGDDLEVTQLIPDGADPHDFSLSAEDRLELEQADLILANGADLEAGIPLDETDAEVWELVDHVGTLREGDPHVWMDPRNMSAGARAIATELADLDAANRSAYLRRGQIYGEELTELDRFVAKQLDAVAPADRKLVTSHDALGYFADRYGFEVVASPFGPLGAEAEPSAGELQDVIEAVEETGVPAVFANAEDDPSVMEQVAEEAGVEVVDDLLVESPGDAGTYDRMIEADAEMVAAGLDDAPTTVP